MESLLNTCNDADTLAKKLADTIASVLTAGIATRGTAALVVSGGGTPKPFFRFLAKQPINWQAVTITLADERWVDITDQASNELLVRDNLLRDFAAQAHFIGLKTDAADPCCGEKECEARIASITRPFDAVILGMGHDGHTASLFPDDARLTTALEPNSNRLCIGIDPEDAFHKRISLTLTAILDSRHLFLHIVGRKKKQVLQKALEDGPVHDMPIRAFLRQSKVDLSVFWAP